MLRLIFIVGAVVSFFVALMIALNAFSSGNEEAWLTGGLLSLALSFLDLDAVVARGRQ